MRSRRRSAFAIAAILTGLAGAVHGCSDEETSLLLTFEGDGAAAKTLNVRLVGTGGALPRTFTLPENASQALKLPGTVLVKTNPGAIGVMAWLEDANRQTVAVARTFGCLMARAGKQTTFTLKLEAPPLGWTTQTVEGCACSATMPTEDMCAPRPNTGGAGGSSLGGAGGSVANGGAGGSSPGVGGSGGSSTVDAGMGGAGGGGGGSAGTGGSGGSGGSSTVDAGPPAPVGPLFGFEMAGQWTINGLALGLDPVTFSEGKSAGTFVGQPGKKVLIESPVFATSMLSGVTAKLTLDVYISEMQDFSDAIALVVNVPSAAVYNQYVMRVETRPLKVNMWNTITFTLPAAVVTAFQGNHNDARITFEHEGRGTARYDRVTFAP